MNSDTHPAPQPRRRYGRWILLGLVILVTPLVVVGLGVASMLTLNRDAAFLRREVMAATDAKWETRVQLSVGGVMLGAVRAGLALVQDKEVVEARQALAAVRGASVGVYESRSPVHGITAAQLLERTDRTMQARGWTRLVGVSEPATTVLIYTSNKAGSTDQLDLCLAVVERDQLVVVSTQVDGAALADLVEHHATTAEIRAKLRLARI